MRRLDDMWFMVLMYLLAIAGIFGLIWMATGPAKGGSAPGMAGPYVGPAGRAAGYRRTRLAPAQIPVNAGM